VGNRTDRIASLKRQLRFHHERRKMVETDVDLTDDERAEQLEYRTWQAVYQSI